MTGGIPVMFRAMFGIKKGGGEKQELKHKKPAGKRNAIYTYKKTGISAL